MNLADKIVMIPSLPLEIHALVRELGRVEGVESIWIIGSQANGRATPTSDWDFLVLGPEQSLKNIAAQWHQQPANVDILVVVDGDQFQSPWPREGTTKPKSGSLNTWEWRQDSSNEASYLGTKSSDDDPDEAFIDFSERALRIHP